MLARILKYDLKRLYKPMLVVYLLTLILAFVAKATDSSLDGEPNMITVLHTLCFCGAYLFCAGIVFLTCVNLWREFRSKMYGEESYLTHTLPVNTLTLWSAKFIENLLMVLSGMLVISATLAIMASSRGGANITQMIFGYGTEGVEPLVALAVVVAFQWAFIVMSGITGIILGNRMANRRGLHTVIWGLIVYLAGIMIMLLMLTQWGKIAYNNTDFTEITSMETAEARFEEERRMTYLMFYGVGALHAVLIMVIYFINYKILAHGVDID